MRYKFLRFPDGKPKAMTFSYDDGCGEDIRMADTLTKYGLKGTFNFNSYEARGEASLDRDVVIEHILSKGHEIAVHGYLHRANGSLRPIEGIRDVLDCRLELENKYNQEVDVISNNWFAIAYGEYSNIEEGIKRVNIIDDFVLETEPKTREDVIEYLLQVLAGCYKVD